MKIIIRPGDKTPRDKKIYLIANDEAITMINLTRIVNRFALNEVQIIDDSKGKLTREHHFQFKALMEKAVEEAEKGKNWETESDNYIRKLHLERPPFSVPQKTLDRYMEERKKC